MERYELLKSVESLHKNSFALSIIHGNKQPLPLFSTQFALDILPILYDIFEKKSKDITTLNLILRSSGGVIESPLPIVNLFREYFSTINVYVPEKAHSAATLIALCGNKIIMSPLSSLSPIDPQISYQSKGNKDEMLNFQFSTEDIYGYYKLLDKLRITDDNRIQALQFLIDSIQNPTLLGQIERVRDLIKIIADRILISNTIDETKKQIIIKKLVEDIPSHNYLISRKEAKELGLPIKDENAKEHEILYKLFKAYLSALHEDEQLLINIPNGKANIEREYERAFIETKDETFSFITKYVFHKNGKIDQVLHEWRKMR